MSPLRLFPFLAALPACLAHRETTTVAPETTPLAQITDARLSLYTDDADTIELAILSEDCPRLETRASVYLDERVATFDRGGRWVSGHDDYNDSYSYCDDAKAEWLRSSLPATGISTITVSDPDTTWTLVIDRPALERRLELVEPKATYRSGDVVTFRINADADLTEPSLRAWTVDDGDKLQTFLYDETDAPITMTASELSFRLPAVAEITEPTRVKLSVSVYAALPIQACTAPGGCIVGRPSTGASATFTFEP